jgi:hypothetical protein
MRRRWQLLAAVGVVLVSVGCAAVGGASPTPILEPTAGGSVSQAASAGATGPAPATSPSSPRPSASADRPPDLLLAAEGGDPIAGQLGSYTWDGAGSDGPWLPGSPMTVGAREPLTARVGTDAVRVDSWTARIAPAEATSDEAAAPLAEGAGPIVFDAPDSGMWTIQLVVRFVGGGSATYAWRLTVG